MFLIFWYILLYSCRATEWDEYLVNYVVEVFAKLGREEKINKR